MLVQAGTSDILYASLLAVSPCLFPSSAFPMFCTQHMTIPSCSLPFCLTGENTPFLVVSGGSGGFRLQVDDASLLPGPWYQDPIFFIKPSKSYFFSSYNPCLDSDAVRLDRFDGSLARVQCPECWPHKNCFHRPHKVSEAQDRITFRTTSYARMVQGIFVSRWAFSRQQMA